MACDVRQSLLKYSENSGGLRRFSVQFVLRKIECTPDTTAPFEFSGLPFYRSGKAKIVEHARTKLGRNPLNAPNCTIYQIEHSTKPPLGLFIFWQLFAKNGN